MTGDSSINGRTRIAHFTVAGVFVAKIMIHDLRRLREVSDATIICADGPELDEVRAEGFRVLTVRAHRKISPLLDLVTIWQLVRILKRERFDLLHTYTPKAGLLGQIAGALAGVRARIHSCRGLLYSPTLSKSREYLFRLTDRVTNELASRVIYVSDADRSFSVREGLCAAGKARYTGSGLDLSHFSRERFSAEERLAIRQRLGFSSEVITVLTVGRFVEDKGYRELASIISRIVASHKLARFLWIAPIVEGEEGTLPADFLEQKKLTHLVVKLGLQADLAHIYAAADLLVHPSHREGVPRAVMEAAAMRVPVVVTDIAGCREVISSEKEGFFCKPGDPASLFEAVSAALRRPDEANTRARAAERRVRSLFDQDALTKRVVAVYSEVLCPDGPSSP